MSHKKQSVHLYCRVLKQKVSVNTNALQQLKARRARDLKRRKVVFGNVGSKQETSPSGPITLNQAISKFQTLVDEFKLNLPNKFITKVSNDPFSSFSFFLFPIFTSHQVDLVPEQYKNVETIFISNNNISTLESFEQFPSLKVLSIANNCVRFKH